MTSWIDRRRAGVLLHLTSLPGPFPTGVLGKEATAFMQQMRECGFSVWQFLPLGPTHGHGSPYESLSSFAGNPQLIDLRECVEHGWLQAGDLRHCEAPEDHERLRALASERFWRAVDERPRLATVMDAFVRRQQGWLPDFALFSALKMAHDDRAWWHWPAGCRDRDPAALDEARRHNRRGIRQVLFEQMLFERQWHALKKQAEAMDILLFGDLPIYTAHDSADVWCQRQYFTLDDKGLCTEVAGVPPDYFSASGQRWGNPLYRWDRLAADGFSWWVARIRRQLERMHLIRLDHFRGLEAYWAIPAESEDGIIGEWRKAPGEALLQTLFDHFGPLPLVAEDLGIITEEVTALRQRFGLPGMKILQFAFGGDEHNPYLPQNHEENSVVYTGTHDNDTTAGWFAHAPEKVRSHAMAVLQCTPENIVWAMIETALSSPALLAMIPMQDLLELGSEARFNTPGTLEGNWTWRLSENKPLLHKAWAKAAPMLKTHHRV